MHAMNCNCPSCRQAAQAFGFDSVQNRNSGEVIGEAEELELAFELLNVRSDQEWEQFLGDVFKTIGKGVKAVGSFAAKHVLPVVGTALKQIAKTALPLAGGALGTLIPIPGVGTALGSALGGAVANALEMEVAGVNPADADIERARRFVRLAGSVMREVALAPPSSSPEAAARTALVNAISQHLPAAAHQMATMADAHPVARPAPAFAAGGQQGIWRRHGRHVVIEGL
jgi:hypothetical protein